MNIPRVNTDGYVPPAPAKAPAARAASAPEAGDVFKPEQNQKLLSVIKAEPEIRPEQLERARALVKDPNYPNGDIIKEVARKLVRQADR